MGTEGRIGRHGSESGRDFRAPDRSRRERLDLSSVEIRYANIEQDAAGIAQIWSRDEIVEHMSGMAPMRRTEAGLNVEAYSRNHPQYHIAFATEKGIKELYRNIENNPYVYLILAEDKSTKEILGTIEVALATATGLATAAIGKWASTRPGIGRSLLRSGHAVILTERDREKEFAYKRVIAGIIKDVDSSDRPRRIFEKVGYRQLAVQEDNCVGWNVKKQRFELRDTWLMAWENIPSYRRDLKDYLPKRSPNHTSGK